MFLAKIRGIYYVIWNENGKRRKKSTRARQKSEALSFLIELNRKIDVAKPKRTNTINLNAFSSEFLKYSKMVHRISTTKVYVTTFNEMRKYFGNPLLNSLDTAAIESFLSFRAAQVSSYASRKDYASISAFFNWGIRHNYLQENPCKRIKKPSLPVKYPLFFTQEEFQALLSMMKNDKDLSDITLFAANTGCRSGELVNLTWRQVRIYERIILLDNQTHMAKSSKVRAVPLNGIALKVLQHRLDSNPNSLVFTLDKKQMKVERLSKHFKKCVRAARLNPALRFHSLRHSFASWLVMKGVSLYEVQRLLGHSSPSVTQIYAHLTNDTLSNAVEKLMEPTD
ncbi:MAG TPA: site-specific integrase [Candidatus Acidoferrales bacterium]|nr:site-specific integrase [Candidatus Acidoferrales bacterium]